MTKTMTIKTTTVTTTTTIKTIVIPDDLSELELLEPTEALKRNLTVKDDHDESLSALVVPASMQKSSGPSLPDTKKAPITGAFYFTFDYLLLI